MSNLSQYSVAEVRPGEPPLSEEERVHFHNLVPSWEVVRENGARHLRNDFDFDSAENSETFEAGVRKLSKQVDYAVEIDRRSPTSVSVAWWTRLLNDLHPNDFVMAAKTDGLYSQVKVGASAGMGGRADTVPVTQVPELRGILRPERIDAKALHGSREPTELPNGRA